MKFVNLTPHDVVVIVDGKTTIFPKTDTIARCEVIRQKCSIIDGIPIYATRLGNAIGLPPMENGKLFIVSTLVKDREYTRKDLVSPGNLIRNEAGFVIGCEGFNI
jgi:hypothetical protein